MLDTLRKKIDKGLASFLDKIKKEYKLHLVHPILFNSIREYSLREGKRIRPILLILSYKGYTRRKERLSSSFYMATTCIELLHNFMLIHDDIIDRSNLRRGKPTLHKLLGKIIKTPEQGKLGYDLGIIAGDIVYALAIDAFLSIKEDPYRKERALKYFIKTAAFTAMGEFIDTLHGVERVEKVSEKDIFLNYTLKTARYTFDCPLVVGAILAGADQGDINKLSRLGLLIGQAFQIQDDIIGIFDTQKNIGKSILSDLTESKKTLLVCHAYHELSSEKRRVFMRYFSKKRKTYQDLIAIRRIFTRSGSLQYCLDEVQKRVDQSQHILDQVHLKSSYKELIGRAFLKLFHSSQHIAQANKMRFHLNG